MSGNTFSRYLYSVTINMANVCGRAVKPFKLLAVQIRLELHALRHIPGTKAAIVGPYLIVKLLVLVKPHIRHTVEVPEYSILLKTS